MVLSRHGPGDILDSRGCGRAVRGRQRQRPVGGRRQRLVAIVALDRRVPPRQRKARSFVANRRKRGRLESRRRVTTFASVPVGRTGELAGMAVLVTGGADQLTGDVNRAATFRLVAFDTSQRSMFSFQAERAAVVHLAIEARRFEAGFAMTGRAIRPAGPRGELAAVRVFMAIVAALMRHGLGEIAGLVALGTWHLVVLSH